MNWATKRQLSFLMIFLVIIFILGFLFIYPYFNKAPTCTDNKQNGNETGVDCGGSCILACSFEVEDVSVLWSRVFKIYSGRYNAVAYIENHNEDTAAYRIKYKFRFADKDNIYLGQREGETFIPPSRKFAIFEPAIDFANSEPVYVNFEFTEMPVWIQVNKEKVNQLKIFSSDIQLRDESSSPRLSAQVKNYSLFRIPEISFVVILYDALGNAISVSKTYLDEMKAEESAVINFTWPEPFDRPIVAKEIIPMYDIFSVKLK